MQRLLDWRRSHAIPGLLATEGNELFVLIWSRQLHLECAVDDTLGSVGWLGSAGRKHRCINKGNAWKHELQQKYGQKPVEIAASKLFIREVEMVSAGVVKATGWPQRSVVVSSATSDLREDKKQTK
jgi:hypothetical protein